MYHKTKPKKQKRKPFITNDYATDIDIETNDVQKNHNLDKKSKDTRNGKMVNSIETHMIGAVI